MLFCNLFIERPSYITLCWTLFQCRFVLHTLLLLLGLGLGLGLGSVLGLMLGLGFEYQDDFSLLGIFVPRIESSQWDPFTHRNESSWELSLPGMKVPGNFCSQEWMLPGTFVPGIVSSLSDLIRDAGAAVKVNRKKYSKMHANNTYLYYCWIRLRTFTHC